MTKLSKKILALIMAAAMLVTMLPLNAFLAFAKNAEPSSYVFLTNGIDGAFTNTGNVTWDATEKAAKFTGSNYLTLSSNPLADVTNSSGFAISFDFKKDSANADNGRLIDVNDGTTSNTFAINGGSDSTNDWRRGMTLAKVNGNECSYYSNDLADGTMTTGGGSAWVPESNVWYNLTVYMDASGQYSYYVDGQLKGSFVANYSDTAISGDRANGVTGQAIKEQFASMTQVFVGRAIYNDPYFQGYIKNLAFYDFGSDAGSLKTAMELYERKMATGIYTNMSAAYTAYQKASTHYDAYIYGENADTDVVGPAQELGLAVAAMKSWNGVNVATPDYNPTTAFSGDSNQGDNAGYINPHYVSLLYATPSASTVKEGSASNSLTVRIVYPANVVAFWDGTTVPKFGVMPGYKGAGGWSSKPRALKTFYRTDDTNANSTEIRPDEKWYVRNTTGTYDFTYSQTGSAIVNYVSPAAAITGISTSTGSWYHLSGHLSIHPTFTAKQGYKNYGNVGFTGVQYDNDNEDTKATVTADFSGVYVLNYKGLKDAYDAAMNDYNGDVANYKEGGLTNFFAFMDKASAVDFSVDFSSNPSNQATAVGGKIAEALEAYVDNGVAKTADTNYKALRNTFDTQYTTQAGSTVTPVEAMGTPDNYGPESFAEFTTAYNAAKAKMAALYNQNTYPSASVASEASTLAEKTEALEANSLTPPSFSDNTLLVTGDTITITNGEDVAGNLIYTIAYDGGTAGGEVTEAVAANGSITFDPFLQHTDATTATVSARAYVNSKYTAWVHETYTLFKAPEASPLSVDLDETVTFTSVNGTNAGTISYKIGDGAYTEASSFVPFASGAATAPAITVTVKEVNGDVSIEKTFTITRKASLTAYVENAGDKGPLYYSDEHNTIKLATADTYTGGVSYTISLDGGEEQGPYTYGSSINENVPSVASSSFVTIKAYPTSAPDQITETTLFSEANFKEMVYRDGFGDGTVEGKNYTTTLETAKDLKSTGTIAHVAHKGQIVAKYDNGAADSRTNVLKLSATGDKGTNAKFASNPLADISAASAVKSQGATLMFWRYVTDASDNDVTSFDTKLPALSFYNHADSDYTYFNVSAGGYVSRSDGAVSGSGDYFDIWSNGQDYTNHAAGSYNGYWEHIAVTIDPNSGIMVYFNGDPHPRSVDKQGAYASMTDAEYAQEVLNFITASDTDVSYAFGNAYWNNENNNLYLDDVRFYVGVKSQVDIYNYYNEDRDDVSTDLKNTSHDPTGVTAYTLNNGDIVGIEYFEYKYGSNVNPMTTNEVDHVDYYNFGTGMTVYHSTDNYQWEVLGDSQGRCGYQNEDLFSENYQDALDEPLSLMNADHKSQYASGTIPSNGAGFLIWAPHVMYNVTLNKWCYYAATSYWGAVGGVSFMLTSDYPDHGYEYQTIIYQAQDYHPNAIDICVFYGYDDDGKLDKDQLYMTLGSWGWKHQDGRYAAIYGSPMNADGTSLASVKGTVDSLEVPADGKSYELARAYMQDVEADLGATEGQSSGEGSYVIHKYINGTNYYYLFVSFGSNAGSYTERVFRATDPMGQNQTDGDGYQGYQGYNGVSALNANADEKHARGNQLLAPYDINLQDYLFTSTGHNSAYIVYNTDGEAVDINSVHARPFATESHGWVAVPDGAIAKRQSELTGNVCLNNVLAFNEDGWPVLLPYQYNGTDSVKRDLTMYDLQGMYTADDMRLAVNESYSKEYTFTIIAYDDTTGLAYGTKPVSDTVVIPFSSFVEISEGTDGTNYITMYAGSDNTAPIRYKGVVGSQLVGDEGFETLLPSIGLLNEYNGTAATDADYEVSVKSIGEVAWAYRTGDVPDSSDVINEADLVAMDHVIYTHASDTVAYNIAKAYADEMIDTGEDRYGDGTMYKWGITKGGTEYENYLANAVKNSYAVYGQEISDNFQYGSETASGERYTTITVSYPAKLDVNSPDAVYCYSDKSRVQAGGYTGSSISVVSLTNTQMIATGQGVWYDDNGNQYTDAEALAATDAVKAELKRYYGLQGVMSDYFKYNEDEGEYTQDGVELIVRYKNLETGYEFSEFEFCYVMPNPAWAHTLAATRNSQKDTVGNNRRSGIGIFNRFVDSYGSAMPTYSHLIYEAHGNTEKSNSKYGHGVSNYISDFDGTTFDNSALDTVDEINTLFGFYATSQGVNSGSYSVQQHNDTDAISYTSVPDVVDTDYYIDYSDPQQYKTNNARGLITTNSSGVPTGYQFVMRTSNFRWDTYENATMDMASSYALNKTGLDVVYSYTLAESGNSVQTNQELYRSGLFYQGNRTWYPEEMLLNNNYLYNQSGVDTWYAMATGTYKDCNPSTGEYNIDTGKNYHDFTVDLFKNGSDDLATATAYTYLDNSKGSTHNFKGTATFTFNRVANGSNTDTASGRINKSVWPSTGGLSAEAYSNYILEAGLYHKMTDAGTSADGNARYCGSETYHYYNIGVSTCDKGAVRDFLERFANKQIEQDSETGEITIVPDNEGNTDIQVEKVSAASYDDYIRALGKAAWFVYNPQNTLQDDLAGQAQYAADIADGVAGAEYVTAYNSDGTAIFNTTDAGRNIFQDDNNTHTDAVQAKLIQDVVDAYYNLYDATNYAKVEDKYLETEAFYENNVDPSIYSQDSIDDFRAALDAIKPAVSFYVNNEYYLAHRTQGINDDTTFTNPNNEDETYNLIQKVDGATEGFWRKSPYSGEQYNELMDAMDKMKSTLMPKVDTTALDDQLDGNASENIDSKIEMDESGIFDSEGTQIYSYKSWKTIEDALYTDEIDYTEAQLAEIYGDEANYTGAVANRSSVANLSKYAKKDSQSYNITAILEGEGYTETEDDAKFYYYDGDGTDFSGVSADDDFRGYNVNGTALEADSKNDATSDYSPAQIAVLQRAENIKDLALVAIDDDDAYKAYNNAYAIVSAVDLNKYINSENLITAELAKRDPEVYIAATEAKPVYNARMNAAGNTNVMLDDSGVNGELRVLGTGETDAYTAALLTAVNTMDADPATYIKKFKAQLTVSKNDSAGNVASGFPQTLTQEKYYGETFSFDVPGLTTTTDEETGVTSVNEEVTYSVSIKDGLAADFENAEVTGSSKWTYRGTSLERVADSNIEIAAAIKTSEGGSNTYFVKILNIYGRIVKTAYVSAQPTVDSDTVKDGDNVLYKAETVPFYYFDKFSVEEVKDGDDENANIIGYNYRAKYSAVDFVDFTLPTGATLTGGRSQTQASVDNVVTLSTENSDFYAWAIKDANDKYAIASYDAEYTFYAVDDTNFAMVTVAGDAENGYTYSVDGTELKAEMMSGTIGDFTVNTGTTNYPYDAEQYLNEKLTQKAPFISVISSSVSKDGNGDPITDADGKYLVKSYAIVTSGCAEKINNVTFVTGVTVNGTRKQAIATVTNINEYGQFTVTVKVKNQAPASCDGQATLNYKFTYNYDGTEYTINAKDTTIQVNSVQ